MNTDDLQNWIFWGSGGLFGALGLGLAIWSLLWDRSRGRRRCPTCWYLMDGITGRRCPECGRTGAGERAFLKTRRRWLPAFAGVLLLLVGGTSGAQPTVKRYGALALVPTDMLVAFAPGPGQEQIWDATASQWHVHPVCAELERRVDSEQLSDRHWRVLLQRARVIRTRERWPMDRPLAVAMRTPLWAGRCEVTATARLQDSETATAGSLIWEMCGNAVEWRLEQEACQLVGNLVPGTREVVFDVRVKRVPGTGRGRALWAGPDSAKTVWTGAIPVPVLAVPALADACAPVATSEFDALLRESLVAKAAWYAKGDATEGAAIWIDLDRSRLGQRRKLAIGARAELIRNGRVVEVGTTVLEEDKWRQDGLSHGGLWFKKLERASIADPVQRGQWSVRIHGDATDVLRQWDSPEYWAGVIEYPLAEIYRGPQ